MRCVKWRKWRVVYEILTRARARAAKKKERVRRVHSPLLSLRMLRAAPRLRSRASLALPPLIAPPLAFLRLPRFAAFASAAAPPPPPPGASSSPPPPPAGAARGVVSRGPVSWASLGLVLLAGGGVLAYYSVSRREKKAAAAARVETFGRPALGGPWSLVDGDGRPVTSGDLAGSYYLLYFGFTFCPDICPSELVKMARVTDALDAWAAAGSGRAAVQPVFVTLDPRRDSCEQVRAYVRDFSPRMLGLTGTPGQLAKIAKAFRVYFQGVDAGGDDENEDYLGARRGGGGRGGQTLTGLLQMARERALPPPPAPTKRANVLSPSAPRSRPLDSHVPRRARRRFPRLFCTVDDAARNCRADTGADAHAAAVGGVGFEMRRPCCSGRKRG